MKVNRKCNNILNEDTMRLVFTQDEKCPICHAHIVAKDLHVAAYKHERSVYATILNFCSGCQSCFITTYEIDLDYQIPNEFKTTRLISSEPEKYIPEEFDDRLETLSPSFVEIYNQSKQAETMSLNHIAGMGYRKSLEFLIKDYAIHFNPDKESEIKSMLLAPCIKTYIDSSKIKTLAEKSAWLGNDETHYVRKHPEFDVQDMKRFIKACYTYIISELTLEEAEAIKKA